MEPREKLDQITALFQEGQADRAAADLGDLWREMGDPSGPWRPMRSSFLARLLARAAATGPGPRGIVAAIRDEVSPPQGPDPADHRAVREWCTLNIALNQADRTLSWLDRVESDPAALESLKPLAGFIPYILRQAGRWPDMARWFPSPVGSIRHAYAVADGWLGRLGDDSSRHAQTIRAFARDRAALVYASMLAAGRDADAIAAAEAGCTLDPEPSRLRETMVQVAARDAGQARAHQLVWLDSSGNRGEQVMELRERVVSMLQQPAGE
jgi:hypothetical protein